MEITKARPQKKTFVYPVFGCILDRFLKCFGWANLYDSLCRKLDFLASCWIPTLAGLPFSENGLANAWENKGPSLLGFGNRQCGHLIDHGCCNFFRDLKLLGEMCNDLSFGQNLFRSCHIIGLLLRICCLSGLQYTRKCL